VALGARIGPLNLLYTMDMFTCCYSRAWLSVEEGGETHL